MPNAKFHSVKGATGESGVSPTIFQPPFGTALAMGADRKRLAYDWFQRPEWLDVPLVFLQSGDPVPAGAVPFRDLEQQPVKVPFSPECRVTDVLGNEEVRFETDCPGRPHLIKVSYHPKWRVEGAETIYLASPAFMVVYPTSRHVRLVFGNRWPDYVGRAATAIGIVWLLAQATTFRIRRRYGGSPPVDPLNHVQ